MHVNADVDLNRLFLGVELAYLFYKDIHMI